MLGSFSAVLRGYQLDPAQEIHALRMLRSMLHGFATLEAAGGFQIDTDVDDSFTWMINFIDHGLQATKTTRTSSARPADTSSMTGHGLGFRRFLVDTLAQRKYPDELRGRMRVERA